jgi:cleavage and polyadenylation specificity factor subunit 1
VDPSTSWSFKVCKAGLARAATLSHPINSAPLALVVDASQMAIGAALQQLSENFWQPLGFFSRKLMSSQQKWSAHYCELYAAY